jgi:hypothetical protein
MGQFAGFDEVLAKKLNAAFVSFAMQIFGGEEGLGGVVHGVV